jgi:hypothetical protein
MASELTPFIPKSLKIPPFLINQGCSARGILLSEESTRASCFKQCRQEPFSMLSWQDPAAWWLCDLTGVETCTWFANNYAYRWAVLQDFTSSSLYYADVITFSATSKDKGGFVEAHRLCAFFMSHELILAFVALVAAIFIVPSVIQTIVEIFSASIVLLTFAANAENVG